jgi:hypothetical protein
MKGAVRVPTQADERCCSVKDPDYQIIFIVFVVEFRVRLRLGEYCINYHLIRWYNKAISKKSRKRSKIQKNVQNLCGCPERASQSIS